MSNTLLRRINENYKDKDYKFISNHISDRQLIERLAGQERIVVKGTLDTCSGQTVHFFKYDGDNKVWAEQKTGEVLSVSYLERVLGSDFIIQEYLEQSAFMNSLCSTSCNTLRVFVYRSVKDDVCRVLNAFIRIGKSGALMDNAHQGGLLSGIDAKTGRLNKFLSDVNGRRYKEINGINFEKTELQIPDWQRVVDFAVAVSEKIEHHRCLNLDIMVDKDGNPRIIEYNLDSMGIWAYQENTSSCYGEYTSEVIDYCRGRLRDVRSPYLAL